MSLLAALLLLVVVLLVLVLVLLFMTIEARRPRSTRDPGGAARELDFLLLFDAAAILEADDVPSVKAADEKHGDGDGADGNATGEGG